MRNIIFSLVPGADAHLMNLRHQHVVTTAPRRRCWRCTLLASLLVAAGWAGPATAAAVFVVDTTTFDGIPGGQVDEQVVAASPLTPEVLGTYPDAVAGALATSSQNRAGFQASAYAEDRIIRVSASGAWGNVTSLQLPYADAIANIDDRFMIMAPQNSNLTEATMQFGVLASGSLSETNGAAFYQLQVGLCEWSFGGQYGCLEVYEEGSLVEGVASGAALGQLFQSNSALLPLNTMLELSWNVVVYGGAGRTAGSFSADLGSTALWDGITVLDAQGQPIPGLQIVSESDINWLAPVALVPLPATVWMFGSGFGLWLVWLKRKTT